MNIYHRWNKNFYDIIARTNLTRNLQLQLLSGELMKKLAGVMPLIKSMVCRNI